MLYQELDPQTGWDIWVLEPGAEPQPLVRTPFWEHMAVVSPDGEWVAYGSFESGREEVYRSTTRVPRASWAFR